MDISWEGSLQHWEKQHLILPWWQRLGSGATFSAPLWLPTPTTFLYPGFSFFALIS